MQSSRALRAVWPWRRGRHAVHGVEDVTVPFDHINIAIDHPLGTDTDADNIPASV